MAQFHTGLDLLSRGDALLSAPGGFATIHENWWNPARATIHIDTVAPWNSTSRSSTAVSIMRPSTFATSSARGKTESPKSLTPFRPEMAGLLEAARTELSDVHFPGE